MQEDYLPAHLATLSTPARKVWLRKLNKQLTRGDLKKIGETIGATKPGFTYENVRNVMSGRHYPEEFGPLVVETALKLIKEREQEVLTAEVNSTAFFKNLSSTSPIKTAS